MTARPPVSSPGRQVLVAAPPTLSNAEACHFAKSVFGLTIDDVTPLPSDRDCNLLVETGRGQRYVMKIVNPAQELDVTDLQTRILQHLGNCMLGFSVPSLQRTVGGDAYQTVTVQGQLHAIYLTSHLAGVTMSDRAAPLHQHRCGACLAELDKALEHLVHPASDRAYPWKISSVLDLRDLIGDIPAGEIRLAVQKLLDNFEEHAASKLSALRSQIIHNDFNPNNILFAAGSSAPSAVIDFSDAVRDASICDIAVAVTYFLQPGDLFDGAVMFANGYHSRAPLSGLEVHLLYDLIGARLAAWVVLAYWRARLQPARRAHFLQHMESLSEIISRFAAVRRADAVASFVAGLATGAPVP